MKKNRILFLLIYSSIVLLLGGCGASDSKKLVILSGSENASLEPLLKEFGKKQKIAIEIQYKGSIDIMQELARKDSPYDAVWPANSLWLALGDTHRQVKHEKSIMTSPVVFGIRQSLAEELGFTQGDVRVRDILAAIQQKRLKFMMTSATQSNSGASAYLGFLYALLGNPDVITLDHLQQPQLREDIVSLLAGLNRSSGSSGWLKELFVNGSYDAMVNYEAMIIEANQELLRQNKEPLYAVYPVDGIVFADSPLGYLDKGDEKKEKAFLQLQEYLLSDDVQTKISRMGRRTGLGGIMGKVDANIFNPDWGIDVKRILSPITLPAANVIETALTMYQTEFRKPSLTVFCLDFSGSMKGDGIKQLKQAMGLLLDQQQAKQYLINASTQDVNIVIPFSSAPKETWKVVGNHSGELSALLQNIQQLTPGGGTDIYRPADQGLRLIAEMDLDHYVPAIILMTDGNSDGSIATFQKTWNHLKVDVPVFGILFGEASEEQLQSLAHMTRGRVFDGRHDLVNAFRTAKGYN